MTDSATTENSRNLTPGALRMGVVLFVIAAGLVIWLSNLYFTEKYSAQTRADAEKQLTLYSGRLIAELQRSSVVPLLLSQDTTLLRALNDDDYVRSSQSLIKTRQEIGAKAIFLLDSLGRTVAASDRRELGTVLREEPFMTSALRSAETVFTARGVGEGPLGFFYSRKLISGGELVGVIVVEVDLDNLFNTWSGSESTIMVTNSEDIVILSTERQFRNQTLQQALEAKPVLTAVERAIRATGEWSNAVADAYLSGQPLFQLETKIPFQGWKLTYLASSEPVRARVNGVIALEIMGLAILLSLAFYTLSRRAIRQSFIFKAESEELRALNDQLSSEITQRKRAERELEVAEQSLAQSSKLAALGEMSAAVSHELNQPLAAMRTYLAGAKVLLQRNRPEEAASSFQRIDDLIGRMGAITKQLKSYARKGGDDLLAIDLRDALNDSLSMMSPQLGQSQVQVDTLLPNEPVIIMGDQVRVEQVIVNLLRNALDAMKGQEEQEIQISLISGEMATLSVQDNGPGIADLNNLFEPFFTTKNPGDGVGLGLAISSGIAKDLGGRLIARNVSPKGAVFEFQLPQVENAEKLAAE
ncbi:two-component system sensor histidine kinase [Amylibacter kogurei]|uniref:C4-dicarboxylate transport sensor protein DctB n=1 Tax=Paramylibacter kogurei TaxID=1889778 RepID=A0A2G5K7N9_9RHOB|nr:ATP-binding protein [Amylibacter kogurei]PIB24880.1 two-component system sensor histidine kinase [Amylibacter kogurei]